MRYAVYRQVSLVLSSELSSIKRREPTSGLEPLTCSLRVCGHVLQGFARGCKSPISKGVSFLCLAQCCTVLRSRWYQSGIRTSDSYSPTAGLMARPRDLRSHNRPTSVSWCFDSRRFDSQASHDL